MEVSLSWHPFPSIEKIEFLVICYQILSKNQDKNTYSRFPISIHLQELRLVTLDFPLDRPCTSQHLWWLGHNSRCLESRCHQDLSTRKLTMNDIFMQIFLTGKTHMSTVWKFMNFSTTKILREINFDWFRDSNMTILTILEVMIFCLKLISRKFWVVGKFLNFHTVTLTPPVLAKMAEKWGRGWWDPKLTYIKRHFLK